MDNKQQNYSFALSILASIFFIFGFATTFIITLSSKIKDVFDLTEFNAQLLNFSFFISYFILSIPAGLMIKKIGYKTALIFGLILMGIGSFTFYFAATVPSFPLFLIATFILASGVVFLQTSVNPYVTILGPQDTAGGRLNLTQALNSVATMVAPWIISVFIFKSTAESITAAQKAETVQMPFIIIGTLVLIFAAAIYVIKLPKIESQETIGTSKSVWKSPHVILGALAIFFYVGAEVGIGGLIVNYLTDSFTFTKEEAATYASIYWGGAMVGRFFGSILLSKVKNSSTGFMFAGLVIALAFVSGAFVTDWNWSNGGIFAAIAVVNFIAMFISKKNENKILATFALIAAVLAAVTAFIDSDITLWTLISIGLFNSIMFPNIFTLAVKDLDNKQMSTASGIINTLIFGGAILPLIMGAIADGMNYSFSFIIPIISYLFIFFFAVKGSKMR
jgi:MFS transporter, FHS family, L-fucose permease